MNEESLPKKHVYIPPTTKDIELAKLMPENSCPRRYCWWWQSSNFDWQTPASEGCKYLKANLPDDHPNRDCACKRADPESTVEQFEPREPYLIEDGVIPIWYWM